MRGSLLAGCSIVQCLAQVDLWYSAAECSLSRHCQQLTLVGLLTCRSQSSVQTCKSGRRSSSRSCRMRHLDNIAS